MKNITEQLGYKQSISRIPVNVRLFLLKALVLFTIWMLLYHLILFPVRFPDKPLTHITASSCSFLYQRLFGKLTFIKDMPDVENAGSLTAVYVQNREAVGIGDLCNGLELYVLYIGFLFCIPSPPLKKCVFVIFGVAGIFILNILRLAGLAWLNLHYVSASDFAHHYLFKMIIYGLVFYTWVKFSKQYFDA